jgi:hypothetical protein
MSKKSDPVETEKGVPLAPSAKDLKPWYVTNGSEKEQDGEKEKEGWDGRTYVSFYFVSLVVILILMCDLTGNEIEI